MKRLLTFLTLLTVFIGVGWAAEVTKTINFNSTFSPSLPTSSNNINSTATSHTVEGISIAEAGIYKGGSNNYLMFVQNKGYLYNTTSLGTIKSVSVTYTNGTSNTGQVGVYFGNSVQSTRNTSSNNFINQGGTQTWTNSTTGYGYFQVSSSNKNVQITKIAITYDDSGSSTGLNDPSISFSGLTAGGTTVTATINPDENASATYYRIGETGDYTEYSTPVDIDLTENASPIKVYAYSTDGTNTTDPVYQEFIVPALGLSISPTSYTGYAAQTVTITPSNYVGDYAITYTINGGADIDYSAPFTLSDPGTYEIVASILDERASGSAVTSNTATITINQGTTYTLPFTETFNGTEGHGGNDGVWSGNTATSTIVYDKPGWSVTQNWGGDACIRLGTSSAHGSITSPTITGLTIGQTYTLTFKAAPWGTTSTVMDVSASGATVSGLPTEAMATEQWNEFELTLTATATSTTITFNSDQNRFWLDEINIAAPLPEGDYYLVGDFNNWTQQDQNYKFTANADGNFYLNGVTITDGQQFKIMKGSTWCGGPTDNTQYCEVTSGWHTDMGIIVDGGSNYNMASGGTCYFIISDRNLLTVQKAPVAIRGDHNNWSETDMTATETGWTIDNLNLVEGNEFQFIDGWNVYHGGAGAHILVNYLGVPLDMGTSGNYYVTVPGKYTITVNRWLNKMTADVERNTHNITCVATPNGGGSVSATVGGSAATSAKYVDEVTINTTPSNGYTLSDVVVTGNTSGNTITVTDNKFMMPDEDVTITATFVAGSYAITVVSPNGTTTCPATATVGQTVSFTVTPNEGYTVNTVTASFENNNGGTTPVTVTEANGTYSFGMPPFPVTVTVTYTKQSSGGGDGDYVKVTSDTDLTDGEYLIVYEGDGNGYGPFAFNGALSNLDSTPNTISVEINNFTIPSTQTVDAAVFTFDATAGTFKNADGKYIGRNSNNNGLDSGTTALTNTVSIDGDENAVIVSSGGAYLRYNATSGQDKFRYYKSSSYTGQQPVALYKKVESATVKAPVISPEGGTFLNSQYPNGITVTVSPVTEGSTIHVTTDGTTYDEYNAATTITVTSTTTVTAYASKDDVTSETVSETYNLVDVILEDVQFSPIPGTYSGAQTLQMYTTNQNAKIYYTTDGSTPSAENGTLYSGEIDLAVGITYNFKAIAVLGNNVSGVAEGTFIINTASSSGLNSIAALNEAATGTTKRTMNNPVQVIYMSTWRHKDGTNSQPTIPEYAYVRDNTGYSLVYFGNGWYNTWADAVDNPKICEMGDWIPAGVLKGAVQVWSDGFHNELGGKNNATTITGWPTATDELQNTPIIPEEMTNTNINAGWSAPSSFATEFNEAVAEYVADNNLSEDPNEWTSAQESAVHAYAAAAATDNEGYIKYVEDGNVWGHYVHLRKNTIEVSNTNVEGATDGDLGENGTRKKYSGFITDQSGDQLTYYDAFYNFSGFNGTSDYSNEFFQNIQNNGGTFDVYGIVGFYGPKAADANSKYSPFEVFPIDFLYIYKPIINIDNVAYSDHDPITEYETKEVTLTCATEGATIWYKTSDMEDYAEYTGPITVDATTTIETYSSIPTKYNDVMESVVNTLVINMGDIPQPVISPESGVFTLGEDEPVDATIAFEDGATVPEGTVIYFTVDGSDPKDENSARYEYTAENIAQYLTDIEQTTTVRAIAYLVDEARQTTYYSREAEAKTYTFVKTNGIIYTLVTDQTQLNESSVYVIVNKDNHMAVSTVQNANNRGATGVKFVDETTKTQVEGNGDVALFMLTKVGNKWYIKTNNSDENGYLYVGDGNTLLTEATATDAAEATINIDADAEHQAHISFVYDNVLNRYLRYYDNGKLFSSYTSETSNLPVSLYYLEATPLANIEKEGKLNVQYTVADQLIAVYADVDKGILWCKDQGDASIDKTYPKGSQIDFLMNDANAQNGRDWDQSNWVALQFTKPSGSNHPVTTLLTNVEGKLIKQATIQGTYTNNVNFTITMAEDKLEFVEGQTAPYTKNEYCTANFLPENLNLTEQSTGAVNYGDDNKYFFMNPKIQEVCHITYAEWNRAKNCFTVPSTSGFSGAFTVDLEYNVQPNVNLETYLTDGTIYQFKAIVQRTSINAYGPKDIEHNTDPNGAFKVYPLDLTSNSDIPTAINTVETGNGEVKSIKYVNVAGIVSDVPFQGVNIVVTEYTDGSRTTTKMLRK